MAIPCTVFPQATHCHLANQHSLAVGKQLETITTPVVVRKGWMPSAHVQGEAFVRTSEYRAKKLRCRRL